MMKKLHRKIGCSDFYYTDGKISKRLSWWKNHFGTLAEFTYELGNLNKIIVTDDIKFSGENILAKLTKEER